MTIKISQAAMERRLVRYRDLRPCTTAFVDSRTPGSERKENFTIIGPGVAENPQQYVHIEIPHGFNIGAARQPPGCVNSQHSHETAEVFIVHTGRWRFKTGADARGPHIDLEPGDVISIPTRVFRGFENIAEGPGFMFAVLGGDDPGRVTWAPYVFEAAERFGLVLLDNGQLIDTNIEPVPPDAVRMRPTTHADVERLGQLDENRLNSCVVRAKDLVAGGGLSIFAGLEENRIIGTCDPHDPSWSAQLNWPHGFHLQRLLIAGGARSPWHACSKSEVVLVHAGAPWIEWDGGRVELGPGDTLSVPEGVDRVYGCDGHEPAALYLVHAGDQFLQPTLGADTRAL